MDPKLLSLLLYVPFLLVAAVTGTIFCIKGYKQGLWRALISLGITVVATVVSILLARLLAGALSGVLVGMIPSGSLDDGSAMGSFAMTFVQGIVQDLLAIVLFALILLIALIVMKIVGNHVKKEALPPTSKAYRWGGLGVRLLDTLVVSLMLLLPLYGTIATYVVPAAKVVQLGRGADSEAVRLMNSVADNAIVTLYKEGPAAWVQGGLSGFEVGDATVDLAEIAETLNEALEKCEALIEAETEEEGLEAAVELSDFLRERLIEEEWFYSLVTQLCEEAGNHLEMFSEEEQGLMKDLLSLMEMSREEFTENGIAILDFGTYFLEKEYNTMVEAQSFAALSDEFYQRLGALMNRSDKAVEAKKFLYTQAAAQMFRVDFTEETRFEEDSSSLESATPVPDSYEEAQAEARKAAEAFVNQYFGTGYVTDPAAQIREAQGLIVLFEGGTYGVMEGFARNPLFGPQAVLPLLTAEELLDIWYVDDASLARLQADLRWLDMLKTQLNTYADAPVTDVRFDDYVDLIPELYQLMYGEDLGAWETSLYFSGPELMDFVVRNFGAGFFASIPAGPELYEVMVFGSQMSSFEEEIWMNPLYDLLKMAKNPALWPDRVENNPSYSGSTHYYEDSTGGNYIISGSWEESDEETLTAADQYMSLSRALQGVIDNKGTAELITAWVEAKGADPLGLGRGLSAEEKQCLVAALDSIVQNLQLETEDPEQSADVSFSGGQVVAPIAPAPEGGASMGGVWVSFGYGPVTAEEMARIQAFVPVLKTFFGA